MRDLRLWLIGSLRASNCWKLYSTRIDRHGVLEGFDSSPSTMISGLIADSGTSQHENLYHSVTEMSARRIDRRLESLNCCDEG